MTFMHRARSCYLAVMAAAAYNCHLKLAAKLCTSSRWMAVLLCVWFAISGWHSFKCLKSGLDRKKIVCL